MRVKNVKYIPLKHTSPQNRTFSLRVYDTVLLPGTKGKILQPPKKMQTPIIDLPMRPIGKELRDGYERVRDEPIPNKLKDMIAELKKKEKALVPRQEDKNVKQ